MQDLNDDEKNNLLVCAYRLARTNSLLVNLADIITIYQKCASVPLPEEKDVTKETISYDDFMQLAVSELLDPVPGAAEDVVNENKSSELGRILLAAYWLSEIGIKRSPANHFMRLKLISLLSPSAGLACIGRLLREFSALSLRDILYLSVRLVILSRS